VVGERQPAADLVALLGQPAVERRGQIIGKRALDRQERASADDDDQRDERQDQAVAERATQATSVSGSST
jgi:hypothetical protein